MERFKDKKSGAIYNVTSPSVIEFFKNNSDYELLKSKETKKKKEKNIVETEIENTKE